MSGRIPQLKYAAAFVTGKDVVNLVIGFALLVLLVLLVKEMSASKGR